MKKLCQTALWIVLLIAIKLEMHALSDDQRPAFVFDDVQGAELRFVKAQTPGGISPISIKKPSTITLFQSLAMPDRKVKN
jgi:hypothetical protein